MKHKRVLYAEDDYLNGRLMEILLRHAGIECDLACDGPTALVMFEGGRYDAVILDFLLPGMSGSEIADRIRNKSKNIPLIGLTSDPEAFARPGQAAFDRVFLKPLRGRRCLDYLLRQL